MKNKNYWKLLKNRNWAFLVVCCFTWDLKFVSNILFMIVMRHIVKNKHNRPPALHLKGHIDSTFNMLYEGLCLLQQFRAEHEANLFACRLGRKIVKYTEFQNLPGWYLDYVQVRTKALTVTRLFFGSKRKKMLATLSLVHANLIGMLMRKLTLCCVVVFVRTLPALCILESCIIIKINLNF